MIEATLVGFQADLTDASGRFYTVDPLVEVSGELFVAQDGRLELDRTLLRVTDRDDPALHFVDEKDRQALVEGTVVFVIARHLMVEIHWAEMDEALSKEVLFDWHTVGDAHKWTTGTRGDFDLRLGALSESAATKMHLALRDSRGDDAERLFDIFEGLSPSEDLVYLAHLAFYYRQLGRTDDEDVIYERAAIFETASVDDLRAAVRGLSGRFESGATREFTVEATDGQIVRFRVAAAGRRSVFWPAPSWNRGTAASLWQRALRDAQIANRTEVFDSNDLWSNDRISPNSGVK